MNTPFKHLLEGLTFGSMRKMLVLIALISVSFSGWSQEQGVETVSVDRKDSYLIIPPEPKLYISSADRYIAQKTGLTYAQIRDGFRRELVKQLMHDFTHLGKTQTLLSDSGDVHQDLI